jgi:hypothetical protein
MELTSGASLTERRGTVSAYGGGAASGLARLRGRMGRKVGRAEIKKKNF